MQAKPLYLKSSMSMLGEDFPTDNERPEAVFLFPVEYLRGLTPSEATAIYDEIRPLHYCPARAEINAAMDAVVNGKATNDQIRQINTLEALAVIIAHHDHLPGS